MSICFWLLTSSSGCFSVGGFNGPFLGTRVLQTGALVLAVLPALRGWRTVGFVLKGAEAWAGVYFDFPALLVLFKTLLKEDCDMTPIDSFGRPFLPNAVLPLVSELVVPHDLLFLDWASFALVLSLFCLWPSHGDVLKFQWAEEIFWPWLDVFSLITLSSAEGDLLIEADLGHSEEGLLEDVFGGSWLVEVALQIPLLFSTSSSSSCCLQPSFDNSFSSSWKYVKYYFNKVIGTILWPLHTTADTIVDIDTKVDTI